MTSEGGEEASTLQQSRKDERRVSALRCMSLRGDISAESEEEWGEDDLEEVADLIEKYGEKQKVRVLVKGTDPDPSLEVEA